MSLRSESFIIFVTLLLTSPVVAAQTVSSPLPANPQPGSNAFGTIDTTTQLILNGVVKFVHMSPTQSRVQLLVTDAQGRVQEWSLEGPTQAFVITSSTKRRPIAQWDHISLTLNPVLGRAAAGQITAITNANGVTQTPPPASQ